MLRHPFAKILSLYLITALFLLSFPASGWAMLVPADPAAAPAAERTRIRTVLESDIVRQRLQDYGLSADEAIIRMNTLSDEQIHELAGRVDSVQAGGDILGDVIFLAIVVLLVVLILELSGHRVVVRH
ncbi:MAG: PA2779 family protein [Nitrospiraceae bacterium]|nr:PA2779 family protein [Nitrospiraceae bacterium]